MNSTEKYDLWQITKLQDLDEHNELVQNRLTGRLMIRRTLPQESIYLMKKLTGLHQKNLMTIYDCDVIDGRCVCLCEYIEGETLSQRIDRCGIITEQQAILILSQVCDALTALHGAGIIHRDVTAANVMLNSQNEVKLIDYDISREVKVNAAQDTHILGTVGYASPEQFGFSQTGVRTDIYACGALLNVLLTGMLPNDCRYSGRLATIIGYCLEIDENKRYSSAAELKLALTKTNHYSPEELHERFRPLPGFRSKHVFPKILTTLCIALYGMLTIVFIKRMIDHLSRIQSKGWYGSAWRDLRSDLLIALVFLVLLTLIPYLCFGDVGRLSRKISPKDYLRGERMMKALGWISISAGIIVMLLVRPY